MRTVKDKELEGCIVFPAGGRKVFERSNPRLVVTPACYVHVCRVNWGLTGLGL